MRRRDLFALMTGSAALWPCSLRAQQAVREIGFLHQGSPEPASLINAFGKGIDDAGVNSESDLRIEHRWAEGEYSRLPGLAKELVDRNVAVIAANYLPAALAAKAATSTIPVVFLSGSDPVTSGLVSSFNRPNGNITGVAFMFTRLGPKNLELIHELRPNANVVAVLVNPTNPNSTSQVDDLQAAANSLGLQLAIFGASSEKEIDEAFERMAQHESGAIVITADGFLISRQDQLVALAARYAVPTIYPLGQYVAAGGLMSYGASLSDAFRQTGRYVGRILKGAVPADLPVLQAANFEFLLNLKTAKELGISLPQSLILRANQIIE